MYAVKGYDIYLTSQNLLAKDSPWNRQLVHAMKYPSPEICTMKNKAVKKQW